MRAKVINGFYSFEKNRIIEKHETIEVGEKRGRELIALGLIVEEEQTEEEAPETPAEQTEEEAPETPAEQTEEEAPEEKTEKKAKK